MATRLRWGLLSMTERTWLSMSAVGLAALVGLTGQARAQQAPSAQSVPSSRVTEFELSTEVQYDSNIARSSREAAAARGLTVADELFTPSGDFTLARQFGRQILFVQGNASYVFHDHNSILDRENIDVTGGVNAHLARCQEIVTGGYQIQQADLADVSRQIVANVVETKSVGMTADCGRATGLAPTVTVNQTWRDYSAVGYAGNNANTTAVSAGLAYRRPALGSLSLFGSYSSTDFPDRPLSPVTTETFGYEFYSVGLTYERRLGGRIQGIASVSYSELDGNSPTLPGFRGVTFSVDVTYQMRPRLVLHASASRATTPSGRIGSDYSVDEIYQADVTYSVGSRLSFGVTGVHKSQDFHGDTVGPPLDLTHSIIDSAFATATFHLNRRISFILNAGDEERSANFPGESYSSTRVGLTVRVSY
jgi:hypothetical protein